KSQPKKTTLMMMVSLAVTLIVFLVFMSFFSADSLFGGFLRGVSTNNYFVNNYEERIVVIRKDGDFLNDDDIEKLGDLHYVSSLTKYSVVLDYPIYYNFLDDENTQMGPYYLKSLDTINQKNLKYGTMPIEDDEVIITDYFTSDEISQTLGKMVNTAGATINSYRTNVDLMDVSIVGTIEPDPDDACKYIYASEEFFEEYYKAYSINNNANQLEYIDSTGENITMKVDLAVDSDLTGRQMRISSMTYDGRDYKLNGEAIEVIKTSSYESTIYISQEIASDLSTINTKQVTLNLKSHDYSTEVFRQIKALKDYYVFSPYDNSTNFSLLEALILVIYSLFAFLPVLIVVYVISYLVIRTIMLSKKKDYTVLRTIGIDASTIKTMSKMEIIFCFVFAYIIIMVITIILNYRAEGEFVRTFIGALKPLYYLIIFIVNMGFGWLIARRYNKLLIKKSLLVNLKLE
ncbi:MAG: hypothetical protein PHO86_04065, partial [Bacilli bacterium]|nr:hypothetical protein [Bacilli bacterium]